MPSFLGFPVKARTGCETHCRDVDDRDGLFFVIRPADRLFRHCRDGLWNSRRVQICIFYFGWPTARSDRHIPRCPRDRRFGKISADRRCIFSDSTSHIGLRGDQTFYRLNPDRVAFTTFNFDSRLDWVAVHLNFLLETHGE